MSTTASTQDSLDTAVREFEQNLRAQPGSGAATFTADGHATGQVSSTVRVGKYTLKVDEPRDLGEDTAPSPVEYALAGLLSCQLVTYKVWASKLGIQLDDVELTVDGDIDLGGFFGVGENIRPGFGRVRVNVRLTGPESQQRYAQLQDAVDEHCPVLDLLRNPTAVQTTISVNQRPSLPAEPRG